MSMRRRAIARATRPNPQRKKAAGSGTPLTAGVSVALTLAADPVGLFSATKNTNLFAEVAPVTGKAK
jgi:hypothetical protein